MHFIPIPLSSPLLSSFIPTPLSRLKERGEEVQTLRSMTESERTRMEGLVRDLEAARVELRVRTEEFDEYKRDYAARDDELRMYRQMKLDVTAAHEALRKEELERAQLVARLEQVAAAIKATLSHAIVDTNTQ